MNVSFAEDMRRIDESVVKDYGLPAAALMENAGRRTAEEAAALIGSAADKVFAVFAGGGNNGGDAFAAARHLMNMGARVRKNASERRRVQCTVLCGAWAQRFARSSAIATGTACVSPFALLTQSWTVFSARGCRESCASRSCG